MPALASSPPGRDEITLIPLTGRHLCFALGCRNLDKLAEVIVSFGELGTGPGEGLWPELWGRRLAMCVRCCDVTRAVAVERRPDLVIRDRRPADPSSTGGVGAR
jgi:hypothetical protein